MWNIVPASNNLALYGSLIKTKVFLKQLQNTKNDDKYLKTMQQIRYLCV